MTSLALNLLYYISSWLIIFVILSGLAALSYRVFLTLAVKTSAPKTASTLFIYGLMPALAALIAILLLSLPQLSAFLIAPHCHGTECTPHHLHIETVTGQLLTKVAVAIGLFFVVGTIIFNQLFSGRRRFNTLNRLAESTTSSYKILDSQGVFAWCTGLISPRVFVSRGLVEQLSSSELQAVLAHEYAHVARKDNLRKWLLYWATITWPKQQRHAIQQDLYQYTEQTCDLIAANAISETGGVENIKQALAKCDQLNQTPATASNADEYQLRLNLLQQTQNKQQNTSNSWATWPLHCYLIGFWLILVCSTVYLGHPLLEWLANSPW